MSATWKEISAEPGRLGRRLAALFGRSHTFAAGLGLGVLLLGIAVFATAIAPYDPLQVFGDQVRAPPSQRFPFGTDANGMDVLSRVIHGTRYAFSIAVPSMLIGLLVGVPLGLVAGYVGGWVDEVTLRVLDVVRSFPAIILSLAVIAATGSSLLNLILVIGFLDAPIFARLTRAEVLALRSGGLVSAAVAVGNPRWRILLVHLLPNTLRGPTAQIAVRLAWAVRVAAALAFVGIGVQAPAPEWGAMIRQGAEFVITGEWWIAAFPGLALTLFVLCFNLLGDGIQELLDRPGGR